MIPQRLQGRDVSANGLKGRGTACRKRLHVKRITHSAQKLRPLEDALTAPTAPPGSHFCEAYSSVRELVVEADRLVPADEREKPGENGILLLVEEQEVGVT